MNDLEDAWDVDTGEEGGDEQAEEDEEPGGLEVTGEFQEQLEKEQAEKEAQKRMEKEEQKKMEFTS